MDFIESLGFRRPFIVMVTGVMRRNVRKLVCWIIASVHYGEGEGDPRIYLYRRSEVGAHEHVKGFGVCPKSVDGHDGVHWGCRGESTADPS